MWRSRQRVWRAAGTTALVMVSVLLVGLTEQPLAGVSWSVITDSEQSVERQAPMVVGQHILARRPAKPSRAWLDLHGGKSRAVNREPDLSRYEF